jgi:hypothetical protein
MRVVSRKLPVKRKPTTRKFGEHGLELRKSPIRIAALAALWVLASFACGGSSSWSSGSSSAASGGPPPGAIGGLCSVDGDCAVGAYCSMGECEPCRAAGAGCERAAVCCGSCTQEGLCVDTSSGGSSGAGGSSSTSGPGSTGSGTTASSSSGGTQCIGLGMLGECGSGGLAPCCDGATCFTEGSVEGICCFPEQGGICSVDTDCCPVIGGSSQCGGSVISGQCCYPAGTSRGCGGSVDSVGCCNGCTPQGPDTGICN